MDMKAQQKTPGTSYLTIDQAAREVGVHPSTIRRWVDSGLLTAYRLGPKRLRIKSSDLERRVMSRRTAPNARKVRARPRDRMTKAEQRRSLEALAEMERLSALIAARHGRPDVESWVLINEARDA